MSARFTRFLLIALLAMIAFGGSFTCHSTFGDDDDHHHNQTASTQTSR